MNDASRRLQWLLEDAEAARLAPDSLAEHQSLLKLQTQVDAACVKAGGSSDAMKYLLDSNQINLSSSLDRALKQSVFFNPNVPRSTSNIQAQCTKPTATADVLRKLKQRPSWKNAEQETAKAQMVSHDWVYLARCAPVTAAEVKADPPLLRTHQPPTLKRKFNDQPQTAGRGGISFRRKTPPGRQDSRSPPEDVGGDGEEDADPRLKGFMTGRQKLRIDDIKKNRHTQLGGRVGSSGRSSAPAPSNANGRKSLGVKRKFVPPYKSQNDGGGNAPSFVKKALEGPNPEGEDELPEELKGCDPKLVEMITNDMMDRSPGVKWDDIAGLEFAKKSVMEIVVWPLLRPDVFTGLRGPPKGLLLFGPPGTGKTLIGKAIASESGATFFSISASSLTSKWHGEGEKLVKTLFAVASYHQPSIIFIDEIDSLLSQRTDSEFEASRRIKTEFLVQLDGAKTNADERVLVVGATNRPQELDEAARRRLVKKLYIPLPNSVARRTLMLHLLKSTPHQMTDGDIGIIEAKTKGYSGADVRALCTEAAFGPIRSAGDITKVKADEVRPIMLRDFEDALKQIRPSVSPNDLRQYIEWNTQYGSFPQQAEPV